jgi:hypothetical protein
MFEAGRDCLMFCLVIAGVALPGAGWFRHEVPLVRLAVGIGAGIVLLYLAGGVIYVTGAPWRSWWLAPLAGAAAGWFRRDEIGAVLREPGVRPALAGWMLLSAWCLGGQMLVITYAGGGWAGDWHEHFERASFFLQHWPLDYRFIGFNTLTARPPLANVVIAGLLGAIGGGFAAFQVFSTLLATLVFFPLAALLQKYAGARPAVGVLALLLMLNPLVVQNATFPWTKLPAAFFVALAAALLPRPGDRPTGYAAALVALAAGLLCHYSTAIWILALGAGWFGLACKAWRDPGPRREILLGAFAGTALVAPWLGWALLHYGATALWHDPAAVTVVGDAAGFQRLIVAAANIGHTFVPSPDSPLFAVFRQQPDWFSRLHDFWFCLYQHNLPLALGLGNLGVVAWLVARGNLRARFGPWLVTVPLVVMLGPAASLGPVDIGVAQLCLQPIVLFALVWVAATAGTWPRWLRIGWRLGLVVDLTLGIVLHFGQESLTWLRLEYPDLTDAQLVGRLNFIAGLNYRGKLNVAQAFLGDEFAAHRLALAGLLAICLGGAVWRVARPATKMAFPSGPATP